MSIFKETHKRYESLDLLKAIAIFLVVFQHNNYLAYDLLGSGKLQDYASYFLRAIISIDVPLFFFVSGAVLLNRPLDVKRHIIKTCKLAGLTFLWAALTLIISPLIRGVPISSISLTSVVSHVWNWDTNSLNHFWFLRQLVILYILFPLLKSAYDSKRGGFLFFLTVSALFSFGNAFLSMGWNVVKVLFLHRPAYAPGYQFFNKFDFLSAMNGFSIAYFMLGGLLWEKKDRLDRVTYRRWAPLVLLSSCLLYTLYGVFVTLSTSEPYDLAWSGHDAPFVLIAVVCLFIMSLGWEGKGPNWLRSPLLLVGRYTLGIFFFHVIFGGNLSRLYSQIPFYNWFPVNLLYVICLTLLSLLATWLLQKIPGIRKIIVT